MRRLRRRLKKVHSQTWLLLTILCSLLILIAAGYMLDLRWTGFPEKTLFDWLQILVFPIVVAVATFVLNRAAKRRDEAAQRKAQELMLARDFPKEVVQAYNAAKRVRTELRAKTIVRNDELMIDKISYDAHMQELSEIQIRFELFSRQAYPVFLPLDADEEGNGKARPTVRDIEAALSKAERYLTRIIDDALMHEYEVVHENSNAWVRIPERSILAAFLGSAWGDTGWGENVALPVLQIESYVREMLSSLPPEERPPPVS